MWGALALLCWGAGCFATACAAAEDEFFKGKQLKIIIGGSPGDGYDVYSRILAKHLSTHLPGNPSILPQNMPGAAGVVAAAYVFNAAPRDGSVIGSATTGVPTDALLNDTPPQFDVKKFQWIGSVTRDPFIGFVWHTSPVQTLEDMKEKEGLMGGLVTAGSASTEYPLIAKELFGFKLRLVSGYASTPDIKLATEREEIHGSFANAWGSFKLSAADWRASGKAKIFVQFGMQKHPDLPDVPLFIDQAKTELQRQVLKVMLGRQEYAKGYFLPPEVPEARVTVWRQAFDATMRDAAFLADMKTAQLDVVGTMSASELTAVVAEINATSPDVIKRIKEILAAARKK